MTETTGSLCQKFTDLSEREIAFLEKYAGKLQSLADAHGLNVFIDCRSLTGRTAIVVAEAKPGNTDSIYTKSLMGMLVSWQNESAVDRSFRLGVPTTGLKAYSVPEEMSVVQNVFPIFFEDKMIAVLIYEKEFKENEVQPPVCSEKQAEYGWNADGQWLSGNIEEAVVLVNSDDKVFACNEAAESFYRKLGYVERLNGMPASNIVPEILSDTQSTCGEKEIALGTSIYLYKKIAINEGNRKYALIVRDITELRTLEKEQKLHLVEMSEFRHRIKNDMQFLCGYLNSRRKAEQNPEIEALLCDISAKINTIEAGLEEEGYGYCTKVSLSKVLERIRSKVLTDFIENGIKAEINITGKSVEISAEKISSVALVVNELLRNAMKHAFTGRTSGVITIHQEKIIMLTRVTISDNGCGFNPEKIRDGAAGLKLAGTMVREKLGGEMEIKTDTNGTTVTFNFIE